MLGGVTFAQDALPAGILVQLSDASGTLSHFSSPEAETVVIVEIVPVSISGI